VGGKSAVIEDETNTTLILSTTLQFSINPGLSVTKMSRVLDSCVGRSTNWERALLSKSRNVLFNSKVLE